MKTEINEKLTSNSIVGTEVKRESQSTYVFPYIITKWDLRFMRIADLEVAQWSKDRSSRVGCVLVKDKEIISTGFNGMPRGCDDNVEARHERPEKYKWMHHAELNAVVNAARQGKSTLSCSAYLNWYPCDHCAGVLVNAGITVLYADEEPDWNDERWGTDFKRARTILKEGGIEVIYMNYNAHRQGIA